MSAEWMSESFGWCYTKILYCKINPDTQRKLPAGCNVVCDILSRGSNISGLFPSVFQHHWLGDKGSLPSVL